MVHEERLKSVGHGGSCVMQGFQNQTGPEGRIVKTGNWDESRFFKHKKPDFLLIP